MRWPWSPDGQALPRQVIVEVPPKLLATIESQQRLVEHWQPSRKRRNPCSMGVCVWWGGLLREIWITFLSQRHVSKQDIESCVLHVPSFLLRPGWLVGLGCVLKVLVALEVVGREMELGGRTVDLACQLLCEKNVTITRSQTLHPSKEGGRTKPHSFCSSSACIPLADDHICLAQCSWGE